MCHFNNCIHYLKIIFFSLFALFGPFNVYTHADLKQAILDGINVDRMCRKKAPLKADSIVAIESQHPAGAYSSAIYEYEVNKITKKGVMEKRLIICKQFKDAKQFIGEAWRLLLLRDHFKRQKDWRCTDRLPSVVHFVKYKGCTGYTDENNQIQRLVLLEKAKGKLLSRLLYDYAFQNDNRLFGIRIGSNLFWKRIGSNLAQLHLTFGEVKESTYISYTHGDLHPGNIFVDGFRLTFIDYATFGYEPESSQPIVKKNISTDLEIIFGDTYQDFTDRIFKKLRDDVYNIVNSFAENIKYAFSEIMQGYIDEFAGKGLNINIDENGRATLTSHPVRKINLTLAPVSQIVTKDSFLRANPKTVKQGVAVAPAAKPAATPVPAAKPAVPPAARPAPTPAAKPVATPAPAAKPAAPPAARPVVPTPAVKR
jgi:tRNA A-37 threonylcarbamoyl transferase component Bud32